MHAWSLTWFVVAISPSLGFQIHESRWAVSWTVRDSLRTTALHSNLAAKILYNRICYRCNAWREDLYVRKLWTYGGCALWMFTFASERSSRSCECMHQWNTAKKSELIPCLYAIVVRVASYITWEVLEGFFFWSSLNFPNSWNFEAAYQLSFPNSKLFHTTSKVCLLWTSNREGVYQDDAPCYRLLLDQPNQKVSGWQNISPNLENVWCFLGIEVYKL